MNTVDSTTRLPSGIVVEDMLNRFMEFIGTGHTEFDEVVFIDDTKYIVMCKFHPNEHINGMRVYAVHDGKHPELAMTLSMIEWET